MPLQIIADKVSEAAAFVAIGAAGSTANYFYRVSKGEEFKVQNFLINAFVGSFIAWMVGQFVPPSSYQFGIVGFSAISSYVIMQFVETKLLGYLERIADKKLPSEK